MSPSNLKEKYGPFALVTGASSGIGAEFARHLAAAGISLVLVARRKDRLDALAAELSENYPVEAKSVSADLSTEEGLQTVIDFAKDIDIGLLVNNAGIEQVGSFFKDSAADHSKVISVNVNAVTVLAHGIGRKLADRGKGGIIFVSSIAASMFPWLSVYSASKAYVTALALTLREEMLTKGVDVLCLEPGLVSSEMSQRTAGSDVIDFNKIGFETMSAQECSGKALEALAAGKDRETPGFKNKVSAFLMGLIPEGLRMKAKGMLLGMAMNPELTKYT